MNGLQEMQTVFEGVQRRGERQVNRGVARVSVDQMAGIEDQQESVRNEDEQKTNQVNQQKGHDSFL